MAHKCEECRADGATLRCTKCKVCFYCSRACQSRNWKIHKRVCSTDPLLRRFVPVEMAIERVLETMPKIEAPKDAFCYICLEGDGASASSKLMRGCACRGDSAGFVHVECLTKFAVSKEASNDVSTVLKAWMECGNCKQGLQGALGLEMNRRLWRRYRASGYNQFLRYNAARVLFDILRKYRSESVAANYLFQEASKAAGNNKNLLLDLNVRRAQMLGMDGQYVEALELLEATLPEAKKDTAHPEVYIMGLDIKALALRSLRRGPEMLEAVAEEAAFAKARLGLEDLRTLEPMKKYASALASCGRIQESKALFEEIIITATRVYGRDHPWTQYVRTGFHHYGFALPPGC